MNYIPWRVKSGLGYRSVEILATINRNGSGYGSQVETRGLPLQGITAELKPGDEDLISIIVGSTSREHLTHTVTSPTQVRLKQTEEGTAETIEDALIPTLLQAYGHIWSAIT